MLETLSFDTRFSPENIEIVYNLYLDYKFELILKIRSILLQSNQWIKALKKIIIIPRLQFYPLWLNLKPVNLSLNSP